MDRPEYFELVHSCFSRNEYNGKGRDQLCAPAQSDLGLCCPYSLLINH